MDKKEISKKIPLIFQELKKYNLEDSRFVKVKIWLMHTGQNFNGCIFSKESIEKAIPTLSNTPILAFTEENLSGENDFSDHRMAIKRNKDGEISVEYLGSAVGIIPESCNPQFETRVTDSGLEREYLTVEGLLWTKWEEYTDIMLQKGITSQSMEISDQYSGKWNENGIFEFDEFQFFGACLLGDDVSPAMENSTVELSFNNKNNFNKYIEDKMNEFNTLFSKEGDKNIMDEKEPVVTEPVVQFALTMEQLKSALSSALKSQTFLAYPGTEEEYARRKYWLVDYTDSVVIVEDVENGYSLAQIDYTVSDAGALSLDYSSLTPVMIQFVPIQESITSIVSLESFSKFTDTISNLEKEIYALKTFERETKEKDLEENFKNQFTKEEISQVFKDNKEKSLEEVENTLFALVGKKNLSILNLPKENEEEVKVKFNLQEEIKNEDTEQKDPYGGLYAKYLSK